MAQSETIPETVTLHNTTAVTKIAYDIGGILGHIGARLELAPHEVRPEKKAVAGLFLQQCAGDVIEYAPTPIPEIPGEPKIWLANMTGSPFCAPTVTLTRIKDGVVTPYEVPHPLATPTKLKYVDGGNQVLKGTGDQQVWFPLPANVFVFPPYTRYPISKTYASWLQSKDDRQEDHYRGKLKIARAPSSFEPNDSWPLTWLQAYADALGSKQLLDRADLMGKALWEYHEDGAAILSATNVLFRALWFVSILKEVTPVPEEAFDVALKLREKREGTSKIQEAEHFAKERALVAASHKVNEETEKQEAKNKRQKVQDEARRLAEKKK